MQGQETVGVYASHGLCHAIVTNALEQLQRLKTLNFSSCSHYVPTEGWPGPLLITVTWDAG